MKESQALKADRVVPNSSSLLSIHPILDSAGVLHVGGRVFRYFGIILIILPSFIEMLGQLPIMRLTPVFDNVGVDCAGPVYVKYGFVRNSTVVKAYICVSVSFSVKAVHLELVSDLTTGVLIASLRQFIAYLSDHGTNFIGAVRAIKELIEFLEKQKMQGAISEFYSAQNIVWTSLR